MNLAIKQRDSFSNHKTLAIMYQQNKTFFRTFLKRFTNNFRYGMRNCALLNECCYLLVMGCAGIIIEHGE